MLPDLAEEFIQFCWSRTVAFLFWLWYTFSRPKRLSTFRNPILLEPASTLVPKICTGKVKSVDIIQAYIQRMLEVNPILNALVEYKIEDSLRKAQEVDDLVCSTSKTPEELAADFPLLGIPFTVKNSVGIEGMIQDVGSKYCKGSRAEHDSEVVRLLKRAGAIPLAVTNVPEMCMTSDTYNRVYGSTNNPYDTRRTPGGSSGGEASLIAAAGSLVGVGTDIAGSVRGPSMCCGIFGHKPTAGTVSLEGIFPSSRGCFDEHNCVGPLCRFAEDLPLMLRVMTGERSTELRLDQKVDMTRLRVFYAEEDNIFNTMSQETRLAMQKVVEHFRRTFPITSPTKLKVDELKHGWDMWWATMLASTGPSVGNFLKCGEEEMIHFYEFLRTLCGTCKHSPTALVKSLTGRIQALRGPKFIKKYTAMLGNLQSRINKLLGDDGVLLVPGLGGSAPYHFQDMACGETGRLTAPFNVLKMPVTACPVMLNRKGMPIGIQVAAAPGQDLLCLALAAEIERAFGGWKDPSLKK